MVTANRLQDGVVVYLGADGAWHERVEDGHAVADKASLDALLAAAERSVTACEVVAPYAIDVAVGPSGLQPRRYREVIRARGPSVRPDLGQLATKG